MADLVADNGTDRPIVDRVVGDKIEERRLQNRGGETISLSGGL